MDLYVEAICLLPSASYFQGDILCVKCFTAAFEEEVHHTIITSKMFQRGERVAIGASGGKGKFSVSMPVLIFYY